MKEDIDRFIPIVREYLELIEGASQTTPYALLAKSAILLPQLYTCGLQLPDTEPTDDETSEDDGTSQMGSLFSILGRYDRYREVFDPVYDEESIPASLSDDLADIYRDLRGPLVEYNNGQQDNAIWLWKFNIQNHCGDHIVDALRVIHRLVHDHMSPTYNAKHEDS
jgi:hypothetical protein